MGKALTLIFGGDTSIGVNSEWMFRGVDPMLQSADLRMVQLEEPFVKEQTEAAGPDRTTAALKPLKGRIDLVTLSGNHLGLTTSSRSPAISTRCSTGCGPWAAPATHPWAW